MKKILALSTALLLTFCAMAQSFSGLWYGMLKVGGSQLRLTMDVIQTDAGYSGKLISVDQGNSQLPFEWFKTDGNNIHLKTTIANIEYKGTLKDEIITGVFVQGGQAIPLNFTREKLEKFRPVRPQEPQSPFPYKSEDITFTNTRDNISLAGTLTMPSEGTGFPVVVLISGSGPQNRNEELMGHKPFLVLADHLTKNGIAVLRYDDRGVAQSKGDFATATSADFANDVEAAVAYLKSRKEFNPKKIGLIGHSEGGLIAPMVAARNKDVGFIVLMAGPGVPGKDVLLLQIELLNKAGGMLPSEIEKQVKQTRDAIDILTMQGDSAVMMSVYWAYAKRSYTELPDSVRKMMSEEQYAKQFATMTTPWFRYFLSYDPATSLEKIKIPVLALNGTKDLQVWAPQNLPAIEKALKKGGNKKYVIKELPNLNHLFQEAGTGSSAEYSIIQQTLSPLLLNEITNFINQKPKLP
ncbi:MAG: alpha/beta hydrolase [Chitinophagaceae bacterium]